MRWIMLNKNKNSASNTAITHCVSCFVSGFVSRIHVNRIFLCTSLSSLVHYRCVTCVILKSCWHFNLESKGTFYAKHVLSDTWTERVKERNGQPIRIFYSFCETTNNVKVCTAIAYRFKEKEGDAGTRRIKLIRVAMEALRKL